MPRGHHPGKVEWNAHLGTNQRVPVGLTRYQSLGIIHVQETTRNKGKHNGNTARNQHGNNNGSDGAVGEKQLQVAGMGQGVDNRPTLGMA